MRPVVSVGVGVAEALGVVFGPARPTAVPTFASCSFGAAAGEDTAVEAPLV